MSIASSIASESDDNVIVCVGDGSVLLIGRIGLGGVMIDPSDDGGEGGEFSIF
jgi:hypothetical protein